MDAEHRLHAVQRRGEQYFTVHVRVELAFTNTATGATVTTREVSQSKELRVTDNGDGTRTILSFGTGTFMVYDSDGRIIAKDTGQSRVESTIDLNGTPDNAEDDILISEEPVLGPTGTNDDICEAAVTALT